MVNANARLSAKERDELESLLEAHNPEGPLASSTTCLHGFLTSVVSGPPVMPSEWMPFIFGQPNDDRAWESMEQAQHVMSLVVRFYNEIADDVLKGGRHYSILVDQVGDPPDTIDLADDWCKGYVMGMSLREDDWKAAIDDPELSPNFSPIVAIGLPPPDGDDPLEDYEEYAELVDVLPECAVNIAKWWRPRQSAAVRDS